MVILPHDPPKAIELSLPRSPPVILADDRPWPIAVLDEDPLRGLLIDAPRGTLTVQRE